MNLYPFFKQLPPYYQAWLIPKSDHQTNYLLHYRTNEAGLRILREIQPGPRTCSKAMRTCINGQLNEHNQMPLSEENATPFPANICSNPLFIQVVRSFQQCLLTHSATYIRQEARVELQMREPPAKKGRIESPLPFPEIKTGAIDPDAPILEAEWSMTKHLLPILASLGDTQAIFCLNLLRLYGFGFEKEIDEPLQELRRLGEEGILCAHYQLAEYYQSVQDFDRAIESAIEASKEGDGDSVYLLATLYDQNHDPSKAIETFRAAIQNEKLSPYKRRCAKLYLASRLAPTSPEEAKSLLEEVINDPVEPDQNQRASAKNALGALIKKTDCEKAIELFEEVINEPAQIDPTKRALARNSLAVLQDRDKAIELYEAVINDPAEINANQRVRAKISLAVLIENTDRAIELYEEVVNDPAQINPTLRARAKLHLATHIKRTNRDRAIKLCQEVVNEPAQIDPHLRTQAQIGLTKLQVKKI